MSGWGWEGGRYLLVRLADWYMIVPHTRPLMMPTMAEMGIDVAGSASATPPTKTTASRPEEKVRQEVTVGKKDLPSRRTVIIGRMKRTHLLVFAPRTCSVKAYLAARFGDGGRTYGCH